MDPSRRLVICVTGMPGAGKTTAYGLLPSAGFVPVSMGDVIRDEAQKRGLGLNAEGQRVTQKLVRQEGGAAAVAELCARKIVAEGIGLAVVDGARSYEEVVHFSRMAVTRVLCVHASPGRRFELLRQRGRKDDPTSWEAFRARDDAELELGVGKVIAMADRVVENEESDVGGLQEKALQIARGWVRQVA
ncbi:MAG: AAA family ATPase [Nitrososphaerota archaeon]|nr:AAA family ATPase [Nitrososphaerota archaeon]MDG6939426.1 AAA family ATPase [Nitrososphaerota archaeon]